MNQNQVKSRDRVRDHGEVLTSEREVLGMLDLVKNEAQRIESRFFEPACGTGNFLTEVLKRKLAVVSQRYRKSQYDYERNSIMAVSSIYGVDILEDNAEECRTRLFEIFDENYSKIFRERTREKVRRVVRFILKRNILWGDALTLKTVGDNPEPIVFSEWSSVNGSMMKRRDFLLSYLIEKEHQLKLFNDQNEEAFLNRPVKEYPLVHFLEVADVTQ